MKPDEITNLIIGCSMKVHSALGPGLLESAYEVCLIHELKNNDLKVVSQVALPVLYGGVQLDAGYRIDVLVEDTVVVELKTVDKLTPLHQAQILSYMKLSGKKLGLLINFNVVRLKEGVKRFVL